MVFLWFFLNHLEMASEEASHAPPLLHDYVISNQDVYNRALTNGHLQCGQYLTNYMENHGMAVPTSNGIVGKSVDRVIGKVRHLNKSRGRPTGMAQLGLFLQAPFTFPQSRQSTPTPYQNLVQFCMPAIVVNSVAATKDAQSTVSGLTKELTSLTTEKEESMEVIETNCRMSSH